MAHRTGDMDLSYPTAPVPGITKRSLELAPIFCIILFCYKVCLFRCSSCSWNSRTNGVVTYHLICVLPLLSTYPYLSAAGVLDYTGITGNLSRCRIHFV